MHVIRSIIKIALLFYFTLCSAYALPSQFVYLSAIAPTIVQEIRYASSHNFVGRPIDGYTKNTCIVTLQTATALAQIQKELQPFALSLKVYDCYRPTRAVNDFMRWSKNANQRRMQKEFYPRINKADLFREEYIAARSGHSRGSTVDLTLVRVPVTLQSIYHSGQPLIACFAPYSQRYRDNSVDMGTGYDCLDVSAHVANRDISSQAFKHRQFLQRFLIKNGFVPYAKEWWHFTLRNEPYPTTYFNFPVQ